MFSHRSILCWLIAALVACTPPCLAQAAAEVRLSFVSFPKSNEPVKAKLWLGEGRTIDIEAPSNWLSEPVKVAPMGAWAVGDMVTAADGRQVFKELGRTNAPAAAEQIVLLIRKGADNAAGFELVALDAGANGFGAGKYLFLNAAKVDVAGIVGGQKFVTAPGKHMIVKPKPADDGPTFHAALYFRQGEEARPFFSSEWRINENARNLVFFYHDPKTRHIRLHAIKDHLR